MTQHDLDRMLFDDILAPTEAAAEHEMMAAIMRDAGATVHELSDMLGAALADAPASATEELVRDSCALAGATGLAPELLQWEPAKLADALVAGVYWSALPAARRSLARLRGELPGGDPMAIRPLPNLMFLRDPCISVFDRVLVGRMATRARAREPLLVAFALRHAPRTGAALTFADEPELYHAYHSLEGGDVLVISPQVLMIGCSERTTPHTIERLARDVLFGAHPKLERVYAVLMPRARSVMHLDTILTQIDRELFLGHAPLVAGESGLPIARIARDEDPVLLNEASALDVLRDELGADVQLVPCGGTDPLHQEREQWTDGANAVALAPGRIMLYARNTRTIAALKEQGFTEVRLSVIQPPPERAQRVREAMTAGRTVFTFFGSELSRARGGGRCLTMPLSREELTDGA